MADNVSVGNPMLQAKVVPPIGATPEDLSKVASSTSKKATPEDLSKVASSTSKKANPEDLSKVASSTSKKANPEDLSKVTSSTSGAATLIKKPKGVSFNTSSTSGKLPNGTSEVGNGKEEEEEEEEEEEGDGTEPPPPETSSSLPGNGSKNLAKPPTPDMLKQSVLTILESSKTQLDLIDVVLGKNTDLRKDSAVQKSMNDLCCVLKPGSSSSGSSGSGSGPGPSSGSGSSGTGSGSGSSSSGSGSSDSGPGPGPTSSTSSSDSDVNEILYKADAVIKGKDFYILDVPANGWCFWKVLLLDVYPENRGTQNPDADMPAIVEKIVKNIQKQVNNDPKLQDRVNGFKLEVTNIDGMEGWYTEERVADPNAPHIKVDGENRAFVTNMDEFFMGMYTLLTPGEPGSGPKIWADDDLMALFMPELFNAKLKILEKGEKDKEGKDTYKIRPTSEGARPIYKYRNYLYMLFINKNHYNALYYINNAYWVLFDATAEGDNTWVQSADPDDNGYPYWTKGTGDNTKHSYIDPATNGFSMTAIQKISIAGTDSYFNPATDAYEPSLPAGATVVDVPAPAPAPASASAPVPKTAASSTSKPLTIADWEDGDRAARALLDAQEPGKKTPWVLPTGKPLEALKASIGKGLPDWEVDIQLSKSTMAGLAGKYVATYRPTGSAEAPVEVRPDFEAPAAAAAAKVGGLRRSRRKTKAKA